MHPLDLIHPVRLRIIFAFAGPRTLTTTQLQALLPDVPKATLYRHIAVLAHAGLLEVVEERRVRGAVERRYRLDLGSVQVSDKAASRMSLDDHQRAFSASIAAIMAEFHAYLERPGTSPIADGVSYRQFTLWLSPEEVRELVAELRASIIARGRNAPAPGRSPYLLSPVFFPLALPSTSDEADDGTQAPDVP